MRFHLGLIIAVGFGTFTGSASAQGTGTATADTRAVTRALADKGSALFDAGAYEEALKAFREADRHIVAPTIRLMIARTYDKLGRLREARDVYQSVLDEKLADYTHSVFVEAQKLAKEELASLLERIPTMRFLVLNGPLSPTNVEVTVNGTAVDPSQALACDPGTYEVVASAPGKHRVTRWISLDEGSAGEVTLEFGPVSKPAPIARISPHTSSRVREVPDKGPDPLLLAGITGSALLMTGLGVGLTAAGISKGNEADGACPHKSCSDAGAQQRWRDLDADRTILLNTAIWSFIGAGLVGCGTVGYILRTPRSSSSPSFAIRGYPAGGGLAVAGKW